MFNKMENINKLRKLYKLKEVYRAGPVKDRGESTAEHTWSCLILADYFLQKEKDLDKAKVFELLIYHDVVEIETGDVAIHHEEARLNKVEQEKLAAEKISKELPILIGFRFADLFKEFEDGLTKEAKFAKAIDKLDALIHFLDYPSYWKGWSEEKIRKYHGKAISEVKSISEAFEVILQYVKERDYY